MSLARELSAIRPPAKAGHRAGFSELHRTATTGGHAGAGKFIHQSARTPAAARTVNCSPPRERQTRKGSCTLRLVKDKVTWQSNTKVSRPSRISVWFGKARKSTNSTTPPNPAVNRTANGLRPSSAGYLER